MSVLSRTLLKEGNRSILLDILVDSCYVRRAGKCTEVSFASTAPKSSDVEVFES